VTKTSYSTEVPDLTNVKSNYESIIHDVNNTLSAVIGIADLLLSGQLEWQSSCKHAKNIILATERCMDLLGLLNTSDIISENDFKTIKVVQLIDDVVSLVSYNKNQNVRIDVLHEQQDLSVFGNITYLNSALLNICLNAIEAMSKGGVLKIQTFLASKDRNRLEHQRNTYIDYVQIEISDTGIGIPSEILPLIFNPGFSTKQKSNRCRRGLGLFRTKNCINSLGGTINVMSDPGQGTTFIIQLPFV
jgi:signal transduction histidine kinase